MTTPVEGRTSRQQAPTRAERMGRLPFTREHRRVLLGAGTGWALDAMDVGLISFVLAQLAVQWDVSAAELSLIPTLGFVGMAVGAAAGGLLADRFGRRTVFALTLLVYGLATGASALAWSVGSLMALRLVVGLGLGAELPVASTLVSEFAPPRIRGRVVVALEAFWAIGWTLSALGGFPVSRGTIDREALQRCSEVLAAGEPLVVFPEGERKNGPVVQPLFEGAAYLAARARVPIVPVGIGGSDKGMPKGAKMIKRAKVHLVVGPAIAVEPPPAGERVPRRAVRELTERLTAELQRLYDEAQAKSGN